MALCRFLKNLHLFTWHCVPRFFKEASPTAVQLRLILIIESGDLKGQMSEYLIPHGEHYDSCILRRRCKSAFLHPEEEIQSLIDLP
jgi:hypothetical protein